MWKDVRDRQSFEQIVSACVNSGRQYRTSYAFDFADSEERDPPKGLAVRLMYACGTSNVDAAHLPSGEVLLPLVLEKLTGGVKESLVVINLDETNELPGGERGKTFLKAVLKAVLSFNRKKIGYVFVILSGTNVRDLHDAIQSASGSSPVEIPLPLLKEAHMQEVLLHLGREESSSGGSNASFPSELSFVLQVLGGVPRYLEVLAFLLGQEEIYVNSVFSLAVYRKRLVDLGCNAPVLLEKVKSAIVVRYGDILMDSIVGVNLDAVVSLSLFAWPVTRREKVGTVTIGELERRGTLFLQPVPETDTVVARMPLVLLLFCTPSGQGTAMLLKHFDVMLSSDENERNSLAIISMKIRGLHALGRDITLGDIFPMDMFPNLDKTWAQRKLVISNAKGTTDRQITRQTWANSSAGLSAGAIVKNARSASFADMIIMGDVFVIFLQEKQRENAKLQNINQKTVPTLKYEDVAAEHKKCDVETLHLFVLITDEDFKEHEKLHSNEIVVSCKEQDKLLGPLVAMLRKFNHISDKRIKIKLPDRL